MSEQRWQRALVTGASAGIGEALCRQLAAAGTDLVVVARTRDRLEAAAAELSDRHGVDVEVLPADLADAEQLARVEARVASEEHPVDLLVNNAGFGINGRFGDVPIDDEEREILVNVVALVRLTHAAVNRLRPVGRGGILNVSSTASFQPGPRSANYAATKAYVTSFSQSVHEELRGTGVHLSALCPGLTRTEFQERGGYDLGSLPDVFWQDAETVAATGLEGIAANRAVVIPGWPNKATAVTMRFVPLAVARRLTGEVYGRVR